MVVSIYHFLLAFYLFAFFGPSGGATVQHMRLEDNFYGSPLAVLLSGTFAVAVFFVLSGFVLSIGFFQSDNAHSIKKLASKRYLRLMIPALASTLLCFVIILVGASLVQDAGAITQSSWLLNKWQFTPSFFDAFKSGVYDIFVVQGSPYNNVLWTMKMEFVGSFIVFGFLLLFGKVRYRWVAYIFLFFITFNTWYFAFVAGMMLADFYAQGKLTVRRRSPLFTVPILAISLFLGGYPLNGTVNTAYEAFTAFNSTLRWDIILISFGAVGLLTLVLLSKEVAQIFAHKWLSRLGKYTFSLYLVHIPVIYSVGLIFFLFTYNILSLSYNLAVVVAFIACVPVVVGVTVAFERYVDAPSIAISSRAAQIFLGEENIVINRRVLLERWHVFEKRFEVLWVYERGRQYQPKGGEE